MSSKLFLISLLVMVLGSANAVSATVSPSPSPAQKRWRDRIRDAAARVSLDPRLVEAVVRAESNFNELAVSSVGAAGLMQVMDITARECGIHNRFHAMDNLVGACACLRKLINRYRGNLKLALAAYNAGPTHVALAGGIPDFAETKEYVKRVLGYYDELRGKPTVR